MVKSADGFSVARLEGELPRSELLWQGEPTAIRLDGVILEQQLRVAGGYLLFLTEDSPFEEALHIYFLDDDKRVVDGLELSAPYASGLLRDVAVDGDDAVSFSFFGDDRWRVEVHKARLGFFAARVSAPLKRKGGSKKLLTARRLR
jgi:hypothetical protein